MLSGHWTYRSFRNDPALVGDDPDAALALIFGEGVFDFTAGDDGRFSGGLGMAGGYALSLSGETIGGGEEGEYAIIGLGLAGTPTEGWRYDYRCRRGYDWPDGLDQRPSLVGTVVRVNAHGPGAPAGYVASFIAVAQNGGGPSARRMTRPNALTVGL
jgi:hypothetical protein